MKYVYSFQEGNMKMREILGGRGVNLAEMMATGLPVPKGFTVTTEVCLKYYDDNGALNDEMVNQIYAKLEELEKNTGKKLGNPHNPLLVSVVGSSVRPIPRMMDRVSNLGMNDEVCKGLSEITNKKSAYNSYCRFIQMYADVVSGFPQREFEYLFTDIKKIKKVENDIDLTADDLLEIIEIYKEQYKKHTGADFPNDAKIQLLEAIKAVFRNWNNACRKSNEISGSCGTAVNIQEMVYFSESSSTETDFTGEIKIGWKNPQKQKSRDFSKQK